MVLYRMMYLKESKVRAVNARWLACSVHASHKVAYHIDDERLLPTAFLHTRTQLSLVLVSESLLGESITHACTYLPRTY